MTFSPVYRRLQKNTRAVEVEADAFTPGDRDDLRELGRVEVLALSPPHRRLDRDHGHRERTRAPFV